jgi:3-hydroxybenzoate 6-monooxygenase
LAPNATRLLREYGLLDDVMEMAPRPCRLVAMNALTGQQLTTLNLKRLSSRKEPTLILESAKDVTAVADLGGQVAVTCRTDSPTTVRW